MGINLSKLKKIDLLNIITIQISHLDIINELLLGIHRELILAHPHDCQSQLAVKDDLKKLLCFSNEDFELLLNKLKFDEEDARERAWFLSNTGQDVNLS